MDINLLEKMLDKNGFTQVYKGEYLWELRIYKYNRIVVQCFYIGMINDILDTSGLSLTDFKEWMIEKMERSIDHGMRIVKEGQHGIFR